MDVDDITFAASINAEGLTLKQEAAIVALLNEPAFSRAAKAADVDERTLRRWLDLPDFGRAYRAARRVSFTQAISVTQRYAPVAVHTLAKIMTDSRSSAPARVSAATALLKFSRESIELDDLASRVDELERSLDDKRRRGVNPRAPWESWEDGTGGPGGMGGES